MKGNGEKDTYHHGDLKRTLISEGRALLDEDGYEGFSLRKLAKRIRVTAMAPYRHFATKEQLCAAIVDDAFDRFAEALADSISADVSTHEKLIRMLIGYVRFFVKNPDILKILFVEVKNRNSLMRNLHQTEDLGDTYRHIRSFHMLSSLAEQLASEDPAVNAEELILTAWSRVHGLAVLLSQETWIFNADNVSDETLRRIIQTGI